MKCNCKEQTRELIVEADYMADPIWCTNCRYNLNLYEIPVSDQLREELNKWAFDFVKVLIFDESGAEIIDKEFNEEHTKRGMELTEKLKKELGDEFSVIFKPYCKIY